MGIGAGKDDVHAAAMQAIHEKLPSGNVLDFVKEYCFGLAVDLKQGLEQLIEINIGGHPGWLACRRGARAPATLDGGSEVPVDDGAQPTENRGASRRTRVTAPARSAPQLQQQDWSGRIPATDSVAVAVEAVPLKEFVHYSFSEVLKANYVIAPGVPGLDEPVTLNIEKPVSSRAFFRLMIEMLSSRGITTTFRDGVFYLAPVNPSGRGNVAIGFGRRPQDVPELPVSDAVVEIGRPQKLSKMPGDFSMVKTRFMRAWEGNDDRRKRNHDFEGCWAMVTKQEVVTPASIVGDLMWFSPLRHVQKLFFHTPIVNIFIFGSEAYHDYYRWPVKDRKVFEQWKAETTWGRLFAAYDGGARP